MKQFMPLKRVIGEITNEARADNPEAIKRAVKSWYNRLYNGSIPRDVVVRIGRGLYVDVEKFEEWTTEQSQQNFTPGPGRPRTK